ncbi:MAG: hypothetical protein ABII90_14575 [Bacteroidota bacterium]
MKRMLRIIGRIVGTLAGGRQRDPAKWETERQRNTFPHEEKLPDDHEKHYHQKWWKSAPEQQTLRKEKKKPGKQH